MRRRVNVAHHFADTVPYGAGRPADGPGAPRGTERVGEPNAATGSDRERITSPSNATIKRIRALSQRKARDESGLFFVEGIRAVAQAIEASAPLETLVVAPDLLESDFARHLVAGAQAHTAVLEVSASVFGSLSRREGPQGLGAVVRQRWARLRDLHLSSGPTGSGGKRATEAGTAGMPWVALNAVQDPGNLGTILRTADSVGAPGVILLGPTVDPYDPSALRASTGAIFTRTLVRCDWPALVQWAAQEGALLVGATGDGDQEWGSVTYPSRLVLLMGSEREGLSPTQQAACDLTVRIPMAGQVDSLNLAVATSLLLYDIFRQRRFTLE